MIEPLAVHVPLGTPKSTTADGRATDVADLYIVPVDPMDELGCDSCQ